MSLLTVEGLRVRLPASGGQVTVVDGVDYEIEPGQVFGIAGESGSGKTVSMLALFGLLPERSTVEGSASFDGRELLGMPRKQLRQISGRELSMVFQDPFTSLHPMLSVGQQLTEHMRLHLGLDRRSADKRAVELLEDVRIPGPEAALRAYPHQFSGGMRQRIAIAIALACRPRLLIADEPTTALDVTIQAQVLELLRDLQKKNGMAILLITHDLGIVSQMAHRVAVMYAGQMVEVAESGRFFNAPQHPYSRKLFEALPGSGKRGAELAVIKGQVPPLTAEFRRCRFTERCDFAFDRCSAEAPGWTRIDPEHEVRCHLRERERAGAAHTRDAAPSAAAAAGQAAPLLSVRNLKVHFPIRKGLFKHTVGHVKAVDGVSLEIGAGRTLGLVGESGCGKTTVGKAILQLIRPQGQVEFGGVELTRLRGAELRMHRRDFQIIFQDPYASLNPRMRVADILAEGMASLGIEANAAARAKRVAEILDQVGLARDSVERYPHEFSGGQRQRIAIARALAVRPKLIVCDEPTSALDVSVQAQILNLLKSLQRDLGLSYLFITHNIAVVEYLAHEVAVMYLGRIVERGTVEEVLRAPKHPYTQALLAAVPKIEAGGMREVIRLEGELPSPVNPPAGCHFNPRCPKVMPECRERYPENFALSGTRSVACWLYKR